MTENRYGRVYFDGVCTDTSNAAYPVDAVRRAVEPRFDPPHDEAAIHVGLTLLGRDYVVHEDGFALSEEAREMRRDDRLVAEVCDDLRPRVPDGDGDDAAAFVGFVRDVIGTLAEEV